MTDSRINELFILHDLTLDQKGDLYWLMNRDETRTKYFVHRPRLEEVLLFVSEEKGGD